jgi:hypothetical protein
MSMAEGSFVRNAAALAFALVFTCFVAPATYALEITTVVLTGDDAPGAPFPFTTFTNLLFLPNGLTAPVVDENERVYFLSSLPSGVWAGDGGSPEKIIATMDVAPGGGVISSVVAPWSGAGGRSVIYGSVLENQSTLVWVLFGQGPGGLTLLAEEGGTAPGTSGVFELTFDPSPQVGSSGEYVFAAQLEQGVGGVGSDDDQGIWAGTAGDSLELLLREGDPAPGFDAFAGTRCIPTLDGSGSDPATPVVDMRPIPPVALSRDGTLAMNGTIDGCDPPSTRHVIWLREVGQLPKVVAMQGEEVSGPGSELLSVDRIALSDGGTLAFMGGAFHNPGIGVGVWSMTAGGGVEVVAIKGDSIAGLPEGTRFSSSVVALSAADSGRVAFQGFFIDDSNSVFGNALIAAGGVLPACAFAVEGEPAPGAPEAVFGDLVDPVFRGQGFESDGNGNVAFLMQLERGVGGVDATNDLGLWRKPLSGPAELIARTGDMLEVAPADLRTIANIAFAGEGGTLPGHGGGIGPDGEVAFWALFTDDSEGVFVTDPAPTEPSVFMCPEPDVLCAQLAALLTLLVVVRGSRSRIYVNGSP